MVLVPAPIARFGHRRFLSLVALAAASLAIAGCTAQSDPATNITANTATLNGTVTVGTQDKGGDYWFEWSSNGGSTWDGRGPHHPWGSQSCHYSGSGSEGSPTPIHEDISGLSANTTYVYRIAGKICDGPTVYGDSNWQGGGDSDPPYEYDDFTTQLSVPKPTVTMPKPADASARRFTLQAQSASPLASASFEYRRLDTDPWKTIPLADVSTGAGQPLAAWPVGLDQSGQTPQLTWDAWKSVGLEGTVQIRARFNDGSGGWVASDPVKVSLSRSNADVNDATAPIGPGNVDLMTGNFSMTSDDASIAAPATDLTATRTYLSRQANKNAGGPFGPGWHLSLPVPTAASAYEGLNAGAVSGPRSGATFADDPSSGGSVAWQDLGNAATQDGAFAKNNAHSQISDYLKATNFGFSIPAGATIKGIKVDVAKTQDGDGDVIDLAAGSFENGARIVKGGAVSGDGKGRAELWPKGPTATYVPYGSKADLWGLNWTPADINAANFGFAISAFGSKSFGWAYVDNIKITVFYSPPGSDGSVVLTQTDGTQEHFKHNADGSYTPETGLPKMTLSESGDDFILDDNLGDKTTFSSLTGDGSFVPVKTEQPGSANQTTFKWSVVNGTARITSVLAPPPSGVSCDANPQGTPGCRSLTFDYATSTTASGTAQSSWGDYVGRLRQINLVAYDPATSAMRTVAVQQYSYDNTGHLRASWDPRISPALKTTYAYDANGVLNQMTPPGLAAWNFAYATTPDDPGIGRLKSVGRSATGLPTETTTVAYGVPLSGGSAPYAMTAANVSTWGQRDDPTDATAIFPANHVPSNPPTSYLPATVHYMNAKGQQVNLAAPGGRIATTEHDSNGQIIRGLDPVNRVRALQSSDPLGRSQQLDTELTYNPGDLQLLQALEPLHTVQLDSGGIVQARKKTVMTYDEGSPDGATFNLLTTKTEGAYVPSLGTFADQRTTSYNYDNGGDFTGWSVREPEKTVVDPGGLNLVHWAFYKPDTGLPFYLATPKAGFDPSAHETQIVYYEAGPPTGDPTCANKPWLANLPCIRQPHAQPTCCGPIPTSTYTYNMLDQLNTKTDTSGSDTRTKTTTYDAAGRPTQTSVTGPGATVPTITMIYDPATGLTKSNSGTIDGAGRSIVRGYNAYGNLSSYTDSDNAATTTTYDSLDRPLSVSNGKGTQALTYDALTGDLTSSNVSGVGTFTGTYDADGRLLTERLPNGIRATTTYDESGAEVGLAYDDCSAACHSLLGLTDTKSIHDQTVAEVTTGASQGQRIRGFIYDKAGRLTNSGEQYGSTCKVAAYGYDADSNRISEITGTAPKTSAGCGTYAYDPQKQHQYDQADRLVDAGDFTDDMGRMLNVAGADAGGSSFSATYYANDLAHSISQGSTTTTFGLDPNLRARLRSTSGSPDEVQHYSSDTATPSWTETPSNGNWTRFVSGISGLFEGVQKGNAGGATSTQFTLADMQGSEIGKVNGSGTPQLQQSSQYDEFGVPQNGPSGDRYGWLGGHGVSTETPGGVIAMGQRLYMPGIGRFLQMDPVPGGSANAYDYVNQDPLDGTDLTGEHPVCDGIGGFIGIWGGTVGTITGGPVGGAAGAAAGLGFSLGCNAGAGKGHGPPMSGGPKPSCSGQHPNKHKHKHQPDPPVNTRCNT